MEKSADELIREAAEFNDVAGVQRAIAAGATLLGRFAGDDAPLHHAAKSGRCDIGRLLLEAGANPNIQNFHKETPLHIAVREGHLEFVKLLLEHSADLSIKTWNEKNALECARFNKHVHPDMFTFIEEAVKAQDAARPPKSPRRSLLDRARTFLGRRIESEDHSAENER